MNRYVDYIYYKQFSISNTVYYDFKTFVDICCHVGIEYITISPSILYNVNAKLKQVWCELNFLFTIYLHISIYNIEYDFIK